jgi:hypothetical protein
MNSSFRQYAETLDYLEVLKITITPEGEYRIPSEKDGRIALITTEERTRLREFLTQFCVRLECPNPEHASTAQPAPKKKSRAA